MKPSGSTDVAGGLHQLASMIRSKSLIMVFSDLLTDPEPLMQSLHHLRHRGNEIILFHILDEAEVHFPFEGMVEFKDVEVEQKLTVDAKHMRPDYLEALGRSGSFIAVSARPASTTCRWTPASTSTGR